MSDLKTVDIKGKQYVEVNERIRYFRENFKDGRIVTEIVKIEQGICVMRAEIFNGDDLIATGTAYEVEGSSFINKTSYIENCETSAIGRALGIAGIGIEGSVASALEVANAIENQNKWLPPSKLSPKQKGQMVTEFKDLLADYGAKQDEIQELSMLLEVINKEGNADLGAIRKWLNGEREQFEQQVEMHLGSLRES
jgi:hypothetical protein